MKLKQILPKTKKALIECPCGTRFFWPTIRSKVRCPSCGLQSHAKFLWLNKKYETSKDNNTAA